VILYVFSVLFITNLTAGVRLPSDKVELKLEHGITSTKIPSGRKRERVKAKEELRKQRQCYGLLLFSIGNDKTVGVNNGLKT